MFWKIFVPITIVAYLFGFPVAEFAVHGFYPSLWPEAVQRPSAWFSVMVGSYGIEPLRIYRNMVFGQTQSLGPSGLIAAAWIAAGPFCAIVACLAPSVGPQRDPNATYGSARWASARERRKMRVGLELGLDPLTGRPIRVLTESHLITIAPPRTGKTSGLVIPNLAAPERDAWFGPAVVSDPKGEIYRAVVDRRRALGRTVRCLDPIGIVGGTDTWNPLAHIDPTNILHLQRIARALLPDNPTGDAIYFQNNAIDVIVAAFLVVHSVGKASPANASMLISNADKFEKYLVRITGPVGARAKAILDMDAKARDSILATAAQAFSWCADDRLRRLTTTSSFRFADLSAGEIDLFIVLPVEDMESLTPLLRWFFSELFAQVRRRRPIEPVVCFIDEAATLGKFEEIVAVAGELPGHNLRLWTFWQDRSQMTRLYGKDGAKTLMNTAEIATYAQR
ncbi:type IV secretory system conjugative DNA transfer family protein [Rhodopseudomonas palustris]|uniref:type IV secretory system conjugative DNA transfer family protein n=1 Tax=Rhodopseudomonas palustris TaxID=1076 RepID=UPI0021F2600C|nr:type IV secretory system conjugative DNA transfer family protein [Rhodopseudomonas palustris]UYO54615.1 type IV secretory system conjugative DNA transfer family protein [Rhodopseudomonas palustris]